MRILLCIPLLFTPALLQAEWLGEKATVEKITTILSSGPAEEGDESADPLADKLAALQKSGKPATTSEEWLELLRLWTSSAPAIRHDYTASQRRSVQLTELFDLLPPPAEWKTLREKLPAIADSDDKIVTGMMTGVAAALSGDSKTIAKAGDDFGKVIGSRDPYMLQNFREFLVEIADTPEQIVAGVQAIIEAAKQNARRGGGYFSLPVLLPRISEAQARPLLIELLKIPGLRWNTPNKATRNLAQRIALESIPDLTEAPWHLVDSTEEGQKLYAALVAKFGELFETPEFVSAYTSQIHFLVMQGKIDEAMGMYKSLGEKTTQDENALQRVWSNFFYGGSTAEEYNRAFEFLEKISQTIKPSDKSFWGSYGQIAIRSGNGKKLVTQLESIAKNPKLKREDLAALNLVLIETLLADGQLDQALPMLEETVTLIGKRPTDEDNYFSMIRQAWKIANLTGNKPLADSMRKAALTAAADHPALLAHQFADFVEIFVRDKDFAAAQSMVFASIEGNKARGYGTDDLTNQLTTLFWIALQADKPAEALALLEEAPWWQAGDLMGLSDESTPDNTPLLVAVARALADTGKKDQALEMVQAALLKFPGSDRAYELLVELQGQAALPLLDQLFKQDPFEERPLIWKAQLQLDAGDAAAAEKTAREAISIDPSDGEQGKGDRMRVYAVLSKALEKLGNTEDAAIYAGAVKAVRLAEDADDFRDAGLLSKAIEMNEESLLLFADAYCIQSRLALDLAAVGRFEEAEQHYRRAYELMPDSFGRVESHCFGCERVFAGKNAESIAEKTFKSLLQSSPKKPQLHYLLGYLYEEMGKPIEALASFQEAVKLDPDYLNAWNKIAGLSRQAPLSQEQRNTTAAAIARLHPLGYMPLSGAFNDLAGFTNALREGLSRYTLRLPTDGLMPLPAAMKKLASASPESSSEYPRPAAPFGSEQIHLTEQKALNLYTNAMTRHEWKAEAGEMEEVEELEEVEEAEVIVE